MTAAARVADPAAVYHRVMQTPWPDSREARWAIGWAAVSLGEALAEQADPGLLADLAVALEKALAEHQRRAEGVGFARYLLGTEATA